MIKYFLVIFILFFITIEAYGEKQIFTTVDHTADQIIYDGKWSFKTEWKPTSFDQVAVNGEEFVIRTGHDYENLVLMINYVTDTSIEKNSDKTIVCFDAGLEKSTKSDSNDYCFLLRMGSTSPITLQGGNNIPNKNFFKVIPNHPDLLGAATNSDMNDRYSKISHSTYEYKIPLEIFGKSDVYGFYVGLYDDKTKNWISWPKDVTVEKYPFIPSPNSWGELISPDKSIPEFEYALLIIIFAFSILVIFSRVKSNNISNFYQLK